MGAIRYVFITTCGLSTRTFRALERTWHVLFPETLEGTLTFIGISGSLGLLLMELYAY